MAQLDHQLGVSAEETYGTLVTPARFFEYNSESIEETEGRTEGDPLRAGWTKRNDRFTPYFAGAAGSLTLDVMTVGFGFWLDQMLGDVATTGPAETDAYTHTGTMADLLGKSFTAQLNRPFHPAGTNQPFLYKGGKVANWTLSNTVEANLLCELGCDFQQVDTTTGLVTADYPDDMENLTWAGGVVTIGGSSFDIDEIEIACDNGLATDRRQIRGNTDKKEPTGGAREVTWSINADFASMAQRTRVHSATRAGALAEIVATWTGPTLLGSTIYPSLQVTIPAARFDAWKGNTEGKDGIKQVLTGVGTYNDVDSPVEIVYKSADVTA